MHYLFTTLKTNFSHNGSNKHIFNSELLLRTSLDTWHTARHSIFRGTVNTWGAQVPPELKGSQREALCSFTTLEPPRVALVNAGIWVRKVYVTRHGQATSSVLSSLLQNASTPSESWRNSGRHEAGIWVIKTQGRRKLLNSATAWFELTGMHFYFGDQRKLCCVFDKYLNWFYLALHLQQVAVMVQKR